MSALVVGLLVGFVVLLIFVFIVIYVTYFTEDEDVPVSRNVRSPPLLPTSPSVSSPAGPTTPSKDPADAYVGSYSGSAGGAAGAWMTKTGPNSLLVVTSDKRRSPAVLENGTLKVTFQGDPGCCSGAKDATGRLAFSNNTAWYWVSPSTAGMPQ